MREGDVWRHARRIVAGLLALAALAAGLFAVPGAAAAPRAGCAVTAAGALSGGGSVDIAVRSRAGRTSGAVRVRDPRSRLDLRSTSVDRVLAGRGVVFAAGSGRSRGRTVRFGVAVDPARRRVTVQSVGAAPLTRALTRRGRVRVSGSCPFDGRATPVLDRARSARQTIGRDGGSVTAGGVTLSVPAGALSEDVAVTVTPLTDMRGSPLAGTVLGGARLEPDGLRFLKPATLSVTRPRGVRAADVVGFGGSGTGSGLHAVRARVSGSRVTLDLWHFSTAGASSGGAGASAGLRTAAPSAAEQQARQRIAAVDAACRAERAAQTYTGPACREAANALRDWYAAEVRAALDRGSNGSSLTVEPGLFLYLSWRSEVEEFLANPQATSCGVLQGLCNDAHDRAATAVVAIARLRLNNCTGTDLTSQIRDVLRVSDYAGAAVIDLTEHGLPDAFNSSLIRACASVVIEPLDFPARAARSGENTLAVRAGVVTYTGGRPPAALDLTVDVNPGRASPSSGPADAQGRFTSAIDPSDTANVVGVTVGAEIAAGGLPGVPLIIRDQLAAERGVTRIVQDRVELSPLGSAAAPPPGGAVPLRARVAGDGMEGATITYALAGPGILSSTAGTADSAGEAPSFAYTAPLAASPGATVTAGYAGATDSVSIGQTPVSIGVDPASVQLNPGGTAQFTANVVAANSAVTWSATGGTITQGGLFTAGSTTGTFQVTATSQADPSRSASATVTIAVAPGTPSLVSVSGSAAASTYTGGALHEDRQDAPAPFSLSASMSSGGGGSATAQVSHVGTLTVTPTMIRLQSSGSVALTTTADPAGGNVSAVAGGGFEMTFDVTGGPVFYSFNGTAPGQGIFQGGCGVQVDGLSERSGTLQPGSHTAVGGCSSSAGPAAEPILSGPWSATFTVSG